MSKVLVSMSMSLDGVVGAAPGEDEGEVHQRVLSWVFDLAAWRARHGMDGGVDDEDSRLMAEHDARIGAFVLGRGMFDLGEEPWGPEPPFHAPVTVVTHRPRPPLERVGTTFTFLPGIVDAVASAKVAAGGRDVQISGGCEVARAALAAGVVDELDLHVAPVVTGSGRTLLGALGRVVDLEPLRVQGSHRVTHLRYRVR